jgi:predicted membrane protein
MSNGNDNKPNNSRVFAGLLIIGIGVLFFVRQAGWAIFPYWIFSWPMILIAIGVYVGVKHNFRGSGWVVLLIIGGFFLFDDVLDMYSLRKYLVPAVLVAVGAMLIFRPKNGDRWFKKKEWRDADVIPGPETSTGFKTTDYTASNDFSTDDSERVDATAIFGSVKKNIVSKNFKGGDATSIFGGSEIDLSKADINGTVRMDVTAILGGVKLIVPSHWTVKQEITAIFGGVEDKRDTHNIITAQNKILVLDGTAFMGGIEISSYR